MQQSTGSYFFPLLQAHMYLWQVKEIPKLNEQYIQYFCLILLQMDH